jgi:hypothetical protein
MANADLPVVWSPQAEGDLVGLWNFMMAREASFEVADEDVRGIINACHASVNCRSLAAPATMSSPGSAR